MAAEASHASAEGRRASLYSEQREYDAKTKAQHSTASTRFVRRLQYVPYACGFAVATFVALTAVLCYLKLGDPVASRAYQDKVGSVTWPGTVHLTSIFLSLKGYCFTNNTVKKQFTLLSLYVSFVALLSYYAMSHGADYNLVVTDAFGNAFLFYRFIQWAFTTPAMLTQMMLLADQPHAEIFRVVGLDWVMFLSAIIGHVVKTKALASFWLLVSWAAFALLIARIDRMFSRAASAATVLVDRATRLSEDSARSSAGASPAAQSDPAADREEQVGLEAFRSSAQVTLRMIQHAHWLTFIIWPAFGVNDILASSGLLPLALTENVWGFLDVAAKVLFSSTLSMTGLVTQDENEKQRAWLAGQRAVLYGRTAVRRSQEVQKELQDRTETLSSLCQEGWGLVVRSLLQDGVIPEVILGSEPQNPNGPEKPEAPKEKEPATPEPPQPHPQQQQMPQQQQAPQQQPEQQVQQAAVLPDTGYRSSSEFSRDGDGSSVRLRGAAHPPPLDEMSKYGAY